MKLMCRKVTIKLQILGDRNEKSVQANVTKLRVHIMLTMEIRFVQKEI